MLKVKDTLRATVNLTFDGRVIKVYHGSDAPARFANEVRVLRHLESRGCGFVPGLLEADAAHLTFADDSFDSVYAPYMISVVPDPVKVALEMMRVCRPGGRLVILNHFRSDHLLMSRIERAISPATVHVGFKADLAMPAFLAQAGLRPLSVEKVNFPRIWSLISCIKD